jgi:apolipoprotein N-acyltransferase
MGHYGNLHWTVALSILALLALYLGSYPACFCVVLSLLKGSRFAALKTAALWVGLEYVRSFLLTGFPWCLLGYSQFQRIEVIQIADLAGVYGVSFLIVLVNALIYALLLDPSFSKAGSLKWETALGLLIIAAHSLMDLTASAFEREETPLRWPSSKGTLNSRSSGTRSTRKRLSGFTVASP